MAVNNIFATFSISKIRHNMLDGFITNVENKVYTTAVCGQIRKTMLCLIICRVRHLSGVLRYALLPFLVDMCN